MKCFSVIHENLACCGTVLRCIGSDPVDEQKAAGEIRENSIKRIADRMRVSIDGHKNLHAESQSQERNDATRNGDWEIEPTATFEPGVFHIQ
jgi:hypothetical protein